MSLLHIFAINVRKYRLQQNLSQEKLAELSGLHRTYISSIEREQRNIYIQSQLLFQILLHANQCKSHLDH